MRRRVASGHCWCRRLVEMVGDHTVAFPAYERELRPYITENQSKVT